MSDTVETVDFETAWVESNSEGIAFGLPAEPPDAIWLSCDDAIKLAHWILENVKPSKAAS